MSDGPPPLVEITRDEFGDALRAVISYRLEGDHPAYDLLYLRDDLESKFDDVDEFVGPLSTDYTFESIERMWHEQIHDAGEFRASVRIFDEEAEIRVHNDVGTGFSIHVDPEALSETVGFLDQIEGTLDANVLR